MMIIDLYINQLQQTYINNNKFPRKIQNSQQKNNNIPGKNMVYKLCSLTHWGLNKMAAILQTLFSDTFLQFKVFYYA